MNKPQQVVIGICAILLGVGGIFGAKLVYDPKGGAQPGASRMAICSVGLIVMGVFALIDAIFS